ncbi:MAG TPA: EscU/YscU/HrcU family type III secretion system export apparatus switch protein [Candidatus Cybelea sp.]|jgi:flagellar biosynthetic protein FlhB|nr:EscU/YscU/HrcU family type III secretion system export apparatus switch protein [Candidatus Cybelea sp.]
MSEHGEKPFEATPRRIAKARREGNIARSGEFAANLAFAGAGLGTAAVAASIAGLAADALTRAASLRAPSTSAWIVVVALVPALCASLAGTAAALLQNGGLTFVPIALSLERLNPSQGLRRVFSRETLGHSLRAIVAFASAAGAMVPAFVTSAPSLLAPASPQVCAGAAWSCALEIVAVASGVGLFFSLLEFGAARGAWLRRLRMSLEERRRELKEEEGDPTARGRRRSLHRALLRNAASKVKEAAFVVVNPVHVAIALAYAPPRVAVPQVLVRALDGAALQVRELAVRHRIPIVENPGLARALYRDGRLGEAIPREHYLAVAEVVVALARASEPAA